MDCIFLDIRDQTSMQRRCFQDSRSSGEIKIDKIRIDQICNREIMNRNFIMPFILRNLNGTREISRKNYRNLISSNSIVRNENFRSKPNGQEANASRMCDRQTGVGRREGGRIGRLNSRRQTSRVLGFRDQRATALSPKNRSWNYDPTVSRTVVVSICGVTWGAIAGA